MFWNRDKTINVKLMAPVALEVSQSPNQPPPAPSTATSQDSKTNTDLALKLVTLGAVASQTALVIYGYSHMVGYYEQFGINTNELALSTPTLLLQGYINILTGTLRASNSFPIIGPGLMALAFVLLAAVFVTVITKRLKAEVIIGLSTWIGISMFVAFFAPAIGVNKGIDEGQKDFTKFTNLKTPHGLESLQTIVTDKQVRLTGHLILADSKSTFLLVDQTVFKIDDKSGRVVRQADLKAREKALEEPTKESPKS
ncbi:hypothetical protein B7R56_13155 [Pseudomonas savastanoi pv. retacarpa]|uniref:hypothetical protein n=1 Tax=Pseudomonas savastanoi TaxID=29438 RepID=UPI00070D3B3F|nr:hypothetical protein [Pseudomonas savastanoi]OSR27919.1 hypothetical protein B7R56_13155 [Pseudomonas savastanoi pv. retacarpa]RMP51621.1 hypothetical protein ALQ22_200327 [Pseudomonas savastanoi pv. retacarpa]